MLLYQTNSCINAEKLWKIRQFFDNNEPTAWFFVYKLKNLNNEDIEENREYCKCADFGEDANIPEPYCYCPNDVVQFEGIQSALKAFIYLNNAN